MDKIPKWLWIGLSIVLVMVAGVTVLITKEKNYERKILAEKKNKEFNLQTIKLLEEIPAFARLLEQNLELAEFLGEYSKEITAEDVDFFKQNPEFIEYLRENPEIVKMIINDPNPREKTGRVFEEFMSQNNRENSE